MKNQALKISSYEITDFIDEKTGEAVPMLVSKIKSTDFDFQKMWLQKVVMSISDLKNKKTELVCWIIDNLDQENKLLFTQRQIAEETGLSLDTVHKTMKTLQEGNIPFLVRYNVSCYIINPNIICKSSPSNKMGILFDYSNNVEKKVQNGEKKPAEENKSPVYYEDGIDEVKRYLVNVRKLNKKIVNDCFDKGLIYPTQTINEYGDKCTSIVFKYKDFFCVKGITATCNMKSSGYEYWEYIPSDKEKKDIKYLFICEAPIDALSLCELLDNKDSAFVAMGGLSKTKADKAIAAHKNAKVYIATDWDKAGIVFHHQYYQGIYQSFHPKDITGTKDWNDELQRKKVNS